MSLLCLWIVPVAWAENPSSSSPQPAVMNLKDRLPISTHAESLLTQEPQAPEIAQVTGVKVNPTTTGLEIVLETASGTTLMPVLRQDGNTQIAEIPNAVLALPDNDTFEADNPVAGIARVIVSQADATTLQVSVTGSNAVPSLQVVPGKAWVLAVMSEEPEEEEITVTGQPPSGYRVPTATTGTRTDTPLRDIPQAIQVVPQQVLRDQQVTRLDEALRNVSGVVGSNVEGSGFRFSVRGFDRANILVDGFNLSASDNFSRSGFQDISETANLEQIEVLKGPASILYGEINPGGVINLVTKKPLSDPLYEIETQIGSRSFFRPRVDFSGPLTPDKKLSYRLNALLQTEEGFRGFDQDILRLFIAPVLTWKISDRTDLTISLDYLDDRRPFDTGTLAFGRGVIDLPRDRITNEPEDFTKRKTLSLGYTFNHRFSENWQLRNAFRYARQDVNALVAIPIAFNERTGTLIRVDSAVDNFRESYALQTNVIGKVATGPVRHTLLFGIDLSQNNADLFTEGNLRRPLPLNIFNPVYQAFPRDPNQRVPGLDEFIETKRLGLYFQDQMALTDNLKLIAGLRYDTVEQTLTAAPVLTAPGVQLKQTPDAFTPRIGIVYQPIPPLSLYASYARSFTPNSGTTFDRQFLKPEAGEGYEVGLKAELLRDKLFATLAYYTITKQNVASPDPRFPVLSNFSVATGEERSRGFEFDLAGEILPGWNLIASYAYTDAEVTRDNLIPAGNRLVGIPQHSAGLWTTYTLQKSRFKGLGFGIGFNYVDNRVGDRANTFELDSYFLTNAALFFNRGNWKFAVNFKNLFDVNYVQGVPFSRLRNIEVGEPFTVIGSISVRF